jgi:predicted nucleic acid-binding protein
MNVVDASLALKWFVNEPLGQESANQVLKDIENNPKLYAVPELFFAEMSHIFCKVFEDTDRVQESISILETLGFERVGFGHELLQMAAELAVKYQLSGYDSIYLATAKLLGGQWYTFDQQAAKKVNSQALVKLLS